MLLTSQTSVGRLFYRKEIIFFIETETFPNES